MTIQSSLIDNRSLSKFTQLLILLTNAPGDDNYFFIHDPVFQNVPLFAKKTAGMKRYIATHAIQLV